MDSYIEGENRISVDIVDRLGVKVGPGPLATCIDLSFDTLLSQAGTFTARFPANDPRLVYLQIKKHFLHFYVDGTIVFRGLAESQRMEVGNDGQRMLVVEGRDLLAELAETSINFEAMVLDSDAIFNAPHSVVLAYNVQMPLDMQWGAGDVGDTETGVYARFSGENALSALMKIAEHIGESFRLTQGASGGRALQWLGTTTPASGVRAVQSAGDAIAAEDNQHICFIQSLSERRDASGMITQIVPFGSGLGDTRLDIEGTSRTPPAGFAIGGGGLSIRSGVAEAYIGKSIIRHVNFKDIRPLFNTDADIQTAKDFLFDSALEYLRRNDSVDDVVEYDLSVIALPDHVRVGMTLRVVYQDDHYLVDRDLVILGIRTAVDSDGGRLYNLTVATTNQWRLNETSAIVAQMEESELFGAHPQIDANSYWENFRELIGDDQVNHVAEMPFFLSEEVVTIRQVLFRYKVDRALMVTNSYAINDETDANPASPTGPSNTTSSGLTAPGSTDSGGSGTSGDTAASIVNATATNNGTVATMQTAQPAIEEDAGAVNFTGSTVLNAVSANTTATVPNPAYTDTNYLSVATATQTPTNWTPDPAIHHHDIGAHVHDITSHQHSYSHTPTVLHEHGHAVDLHSHDQAAHAHTMDSHTHTQVAHGHTSPVHSHSTPAHSHTIAATHSHTIAHDHASPQHVHGIPDLVETQAVTRIAALNSYTIGELECAINGGAWLNLESEGIPIAGGFYELDITPLIQNPNGLRRPYQENNLIEVRRTTAAGTGKSAQIRVKLGIRSTIQSVVVYS